MKICGRLNLAFFSFFTFGAIVGLASSASASHQITKRAKMGVSTAITDNFVCDGSRVVGASISESPKFGTISISTKREKVSAKKLRSTPIRCEGEIVPITYVNYKSKAGYKGEDGFTVLWDNGNRKTYNLIVR